MGNLNPEIAIKYMTLAQVLASAALHAQQSDKVMPGDVFSFTSLLTTSNQDGPATVRVGAGQ